MNVSIDVTKIDKTKLFQGKKGTYLKLTMALNDEKDQYGNDIAVWQEQDKEERDRPKNYLGNGKVFWSGDKSPEKLDEPSDLPF